MSIFFSKAARTTTAVVISSLSLAGMAFAAFSGGADVGQFCQEQFPNAAPPVIAGCCVGGCGSIHSDPKSDDATGNVFAVDLIPTAYERLGTSYVYRLPLGMDGVNFPGDCSIGDPPSVQILGPASSAVLVDAATNWHGERSSSMDRPVMNVLYADGHVRFSSGIDFLRAWLCDPR